MRKPMILLSALATAFSLWWFIAHILRGKVGDWEFWFAFGYLLFCATNLLYLLRTPRSA